MKAIWNGAVLAQSDDTVVVESNHYFPAESLRREHFRPSDTHLRTQEMVRDRVWLMAETLIDKIWSTHLVGQRIDGKDLIAGARADEDLFQSRVVAQIINIAEWKAMDPQPSLA